MVLVAYPVAPGAALDEAALFALRGEGPGRVREDDPAATDQPTADGRQPSAISR